MRRLAELSLSNRALIALVTVFVMVFGVVTTRGLKQELIPSLTIPTAFVYTTYPGASPQVVEEKVTTPIEQAVLGLNDLESSSSTSSTGVSMVTVNMTYGVNMSTVQQDLQSAVSRIQGQLPDDVESQVITGSFDDLPVLVLSVDSDLEPQKLSDELNDLAKPDLEKVDGVRSVQISGAPERRVEIALDLDKMEDEGVTVNDVSQAVGSAGGLVSGGSLEQGRNTLAVTIGERFSSAKDVGLVTMAVTENPTAAEQQEAAVTGETLKPTVKTVELKDIADVKEVNAPQTSISRTDGKASLTLAVTKTPDGNTVQVANSVNALLPGLQDKLGGEARFTSVFDQAPFITDSIHDLLVEGGLGLAMAILVILVFLLSVRSTIVTAISIPVSVLMAMIGMGVAGFSLNILTLGALTISIGRVVDDSIVVIENIKRHLAYGEDKLTAIRTAVGEVATAITAATITTVAVFLPIALVGGQTGELFRPFALTVTLSLLASLIVALTIVPVLAYWFLRSPRGTVDADQVRAQAEAKEHRSLLQRSYVPVLRGAMRHPVVSLLLAVLILAGTVALAPRLKTNFLGNSGQNTLTVTQAYPPALSLEEQSRRAERVEDALGEVPGVTTVQMSVGSADATGSAFGFGGSADTATFSITTDAEADQVAVEGQVRSAVDDFTGDGQVTVTANAQQGSSTVDVIVNAPDTTRLRQASDQVEKALGKVPGAADVSSSLAADQPQIQVRVDPAKAAKKGMSDSTVAQALKGVLTPATVGQVEQTGGTTVDVVLKPGKAPIGIDKLRDLELTTPSGDKVKLEDLAEVKRTTVATSIEHTDGQRSATITLTPTADNLGAVTTAVNAELAAVKLPTGVTAEVGGVSAEQADAFSQLGLALLVAVAIVYVVMVATFKSLIQPLILTISIPFAATGALVALLITDTPLGVPSLIGLLMLIGIVVTNAIVLIDLVNHYRLQGQSVDEALINGARQRLRPILMTALATVMALVPMALGLSGGGVFISKPLAIVVIGGLVSSTVLTLLLVPVLYRLVEGRKERRARRREERDIDAASASAAPVDTAPAHSAPAEEAPAHAAPAEEARAPDPVPQHALPAEDESAETADGQQVRESPNAPTASKRPRRARRGGQWP